MFVRFLSFGSLCVLAACGGSNSGGTPPVVTPQSASGFATAGDVIRAGSTFTVSATPRVVDEADGDLQLEDQQVTFAIREDSPRIDVTLDGVTYTLDRVSATRFINLDDGNVVVFSRIITDVEYAEVGNMFSVQDGALNDALFVFGFDTSPTAVSARGATAQYTSDIALTARNGFDFGVGVGEITLDVNFGNDTVGGSFTSRPIGTATSDAVVLPTATFTLNPSRISGNTFDGSVRLTSGTIDGTLSGAAYDSTFFGPTAETVGGTVSATVDITGEARDTIVTGAFVAD